MENLSIYISKEEYESLLKSIVFMGTIYGLMGDFVDKKYKKESSIVGQLEDKLCSFSSQFGLSSITEEFEGRKVLKMESSWYQKVTDDMDKYEEYITYNNLSNKLAWRDFEREYSLKEIKKMVTKNSGYLGPELYKYEEKYWKEFDEHEYSRLEIKKD